VAFIQDKPEDFAATALDGFCSAFPRWVRRVQGGAVRATQTPRGKVAIVIGGGSGHYPAFAGYVGPGLADGAVAGDIFAEIAGKYNEGSVSVILCSLHAKKVGSGRLPFSYGCCDLGGVCKAGVVTWNSYPDRLVFLIKI